MSFLLDFPSEYKPSYNICKRNVSVRLNRNRFSLHISIVLISLFGLAGCAMPEIESTWRDRKVFIDGVDDGSEWDDARYILEKENMILGFLNDEDFCYIRLSSRDRNMQRQVLTSGFTVWLNENGEKKKTLGIHFPLGNRAGNMEMMRRNIDAPTADNSDRLRTMIEMVQTAIEILGYDEDARTVLTPDELRDCGIDIKLNESKGTLVYELRIPLLRDESHPYGIGTERSGKIAICLESGSVGTDQSRNQSENHGKRGVMGGRGGNPKGMVGGGTGRPAGSGGGMGESGSMREGGRTVEPVEFWLTVALARKS